MKKNLDRIIKFTGIIFRLEKRVIKKMFYVVQNINPTRIFNTFMCIRTF